MKNYLVFIVIFIGFFVCSFSSKEYDKEIIIVNCGKVGRKDIAKEINIINKYKPRVLGVDLFFSKDSGAGDDDLVLALNNSKNLVMIEGIRDYDSINDCFQKLKKSHPKFCKNAKTGFSNLMSDEEGIVKYFALSETICSGEIKNLSSFGLTMAATSEIGKGKEFILDITEKILKINFTAPNRYRTIEVNDILNQKVDLNCLRNKIVLLGYIGNDTEDLHYINESDPAKKEKLPIYGVVIHANIISTILGMKL
jgi:CHASE2 domain-containing sensor protein